MKNKTTDHSTITKTNLIINPQNLNDRIQKPKEEQTRIQYKIITNQKPKTNTILLKRTKNGYIITKPKRIQNS